MPTIHENLKQLRQSRGMTQAEVAEALSVVRQTVSSYESGRTQPDLQMLKQLAALYRVDLYDILYGLDRLQRRLRLVRRVALAVAAILILGLLAHSALLLAMNTYLPVSPGANPVNEQTRPMLNMRMSLLKAAEAAAGLTGLLFTLGAIALLFLLLYTPDLVPLRTQLLWLLGLGAAAALASIPFYMADSIYRLADYMLPALNPLLLALFLFLISLAVTLIRRRRRR